MTHQSIDTPEELSNDDQEHDEKKDLVHCFLFKDLVAKVGRDPGLVQLLVVVGSESDPLRRRANHVSRSHLMIIGIPFEASGA